MISHTSTSALIGISAVQVDVEVDVREGKHQFTVIGLADGAVKEARDRVTSALKVCGFEVPENILVNLAPAELRKEGSSYDLAIAIGILRSSGQLRCKDSLKRAFHGELSLEGLIKPVRGTVALTINALENGCSEVVVPELNSAEAALISGIRVAAPRSPSKLVAYLEGRDNSLTKLVPAVPVNLGQQQDLGDVRGQKIAKRAMFIAAAGGHNLLMIGPPGCGKSMLAARFSSLLPLLTQAERLEVVKIHSVAGLPVQTYLAGQRPYREPHHSISEPGLIGGGNPPRPGEISLAHLGVLFLDEFPEFGRSALEAPRSPLERGSVSVVRARASVEFPADFQLLAAMNPCPCGRLGMQSAVCLCSAVSIQNYLKKLSQPLLDRIDLHVELNAVPLHDLKSSSTNSAAENTQLVTQILAARERAIKQRGKINALLSNTELAKSCSLTQSAQKLLHAYYERNALSARGFFRTLRVALTIAELQASERILDDHIAEALSFRGLQILSQYSGNVNSGRNRVGI